MLLLWRLWTSINTFYFLSIWNYVAGSSNPWYMEYLFSFAELILCSFYPWNKSNQPFAFLQCITKLYLHPFEVFHTMKDSQILFCVTREIPIVGFRGWNHIDEVNCTRKDVGKNWTHNPGTRIISPNHNCMTDLVSSLLRFIECAKIHHQCMLELLFLKVIGGMWLSF